jgi:hypothetical protein
VVHLDRGGRQVPRRGGQAPDRPRGGGETPA